MIRFLMIWGCLFTVVVAAPAISWGGPLGSRIWNEVGDAGDTLATANVPTGGGTLDEILGHLPDDDPKFIDLYKILIPDLSQFGATSAVNGTELFDSWLYLFDVDGKGIAASGSSTDRFFASNGEIAQGSFSGPGGVHYLGISRLLTVAVNASGDPIFEDVDFSFDGELVFPANADPLAGWGLPGLSVDEPYPEYRIVLTGAMAVPEPASIAIWSLAFGFTVLHLRRHVRVVDHSGKGAPPPAADQRGNLH